jgi:lysophospholipase L1-like esterase
MRRVLLLSLAVNAFALGIAVRGIYIRGGWEYLHDRIAKPTSPETLDSDAVTYAHRQTLFDRLPTRDRLVVFLGDSLTAGCEWSEFFPGVLNRGIGGDTSAGVLKRLGSITKLRPSAVFLLIGSNDRLNLGIPPEQTIANVRAIVAQIRSKSPETNAIYLESNLPGVETSKNIHVRQVNQGLKLLADGKTIFYLDLYPSFLDGNTLNPRFSSDGNHLNGEGYLVWKRMIESYVDQWALRAEHKLSQTTR